jgi:histidine ammonia-lyase
MGSIAARHARAVLDGVERIVAIELVVGAQALDLRLASMAGGDGGAPVPGAGVAEAHARIRARIAHLDRDREPAADLAAATTLVHDGALVDLVGPALIDATDRARRRLRVR